MSDPVPTRTRVLLLAGASGSGKSTLVRRLQADRPVTVVTLDDFYREGTDPALPRAHGIVDWDDPASWDDERALAALARLCRTGSTEVPVYDISASAVVDTARLDVPTGGLVVAEGLFAPRLVQPLREHGLLLDAVHLRSRPALTFVRRLARDLAGHRKPPLTLVRRGLALARDEPRLVRGWCELGTRPVSKQEVLDLVVAKVPARVL